MAERVADQFEYDGPWIDCWNCDGGSYADCHEEYACVDPENGCDLCLRKCDVCNGKGGWFADDPEQQP